MARAYSRHDKVAGRFPDMPLEEDLVSGRHNNRSIELSPEYRGVPLCQVRTEVCTKPGVTKPGVWSAFQGVDPRAHNPKVAGSNPAPAANADAQNAG